MLYTPEMLRFFRSDNYSISDINLCFNAAINLGYNKRKQMNFIKTILHCIKTEDKIFNYLNHQKIIPGNTENESINRVLKYIYIQNRSQTSIRENIALIAQLTQIIKQDSHYH